MCVSRHSASSKCHQLADDGVRVLPANDHPSPSNTCFRVERAGYGPDQPGDSFATIAITWARSTTSLLPVRSGSVVETTACEQQAAAGRSANPIAASAAGFKRRRARPSAARRRRPAIASLSGTIGSGEGHSRRGVPTQIRDCARRSAGPGFGDRESRNRPRTAEAPLPVLVHNDSGATTVGCSCCLKVTLCEPRAL
jgi:hypothetical protein